MKNLIQFLNSIHPLSIELQDHLFKILKHQDVSKKELLLHQTQTCKYIYFIEKGLFRCYHINNEGKEICSWFMKTGDVIISVESFFKQKPSLENIQALEKSSVYFISYEELSQTYQQFPEFNTTARILTEHYYCQSEQRLFWLRCTKAKERYRLLAENYPELIQLVNSKHIASFLGITLETLSRLKSKW
jgi:CRP-like cAMP-binding protein